LEKNGLNEATVIIDAANDPVINAGLKAYGDKVPLLVSYIPEQGKPGKIVPGFQPKEYERLAALYRQVTQVEGFEVVSGVVVKPRAPGKT